MALQPVRGTHDLYGPDMQKYLYIVETARRVAARYGFEEMSTPIFEFTQVFQRTLGETSDIVNKEMYTFEDRGGDSLTLRPEGTAPIARAFISEGLSQSSPCKFFYQGPMFRYERPQKGRTRQFHQFGVELIGVAQPQADIEVLSMAWNILSELNLSRSVQLKINSIGDDDSRNRFRQALVGYLTPLSSKLSEDSQKRLLTNPLRILDSKVEGDQKLLEKAPQLKDFFTPEANAYFETVRSGLDQLEIPYEIEPKLVRGLDYYCHVVFEFCSSDLGAQNAVLSGGRYDKLIEQMGGSKTPGVGFAAGLERLILLFNEVPDSPRPVSLVPLGEEAETACIKLSHELRAKGFCVEMSYSGNLSKRMKRANKAKAFAAIILGSEEIKNGVATWKDLDSGAQQEVRLTELPAFLQKMSHDPSL